MARPPVSELALSRAWADGAFPSSLSIRNGESIEIVYRGVWTHGLGPDFANAMIAHTDGRLLSGSIEIHLTTSGWREHGHHRDPAYNDVILHIVGIDDGSETRRVDGKLVPVAVVGFDQARATMDQLDWSRVGGDVCAAELAATQPARIARALHGLGDQRLAIKASQYEAELALETPAQVLWRGLLESLGYSENRTPMRSLAGLLPIIDLERSLSRSVSRFDTAASLLLGSAGFLPLAPRDAETGGLTPEQVARLETNWGQQARPISERLQPAEWQLTRVRPANHPVARLLVAAALCSEFSFGIMSTLLESLRAGQFQIDYLIAASAAHGVTLGRDRATVMASSVIIPFALALAEQTGDAELLDGAMTAWDRLPASSHNRITRAAQLQVTGGLPLKQLGERGIHGLLHLNRTLCTPRRCFECPIAALVVAESEQTSAD